MTAGATQRSAEPTALFTIGEVLNQLREEFPDVSPSRVRFYEEKGLVSPSRTPAGYRKYAEGDVERLRYVLRAKRDHYLPLDVIREHLDKIDRGLMPQISDVTPAVPKDAAQTPEGSQPPRAHRIELTGAELVEATGAEMSLLDALEEHGLVRPAPGGLYQEDAIAIVRAAVELGALGLEPRHLRPLRVAAEREVGLVEQVVQPELARPEGRDRAMDRAHQVSGVALTLHAALVRAGVNRMLD